ncbi:MAG: ATP-dependent RecD-like DNA helicase [Oscillospiraceae bacterium]|nr:ATP-dependent RecD-like DNA helicase [Oscillospiraceae bacterium]
MVCTFQRLIYPRSTSDIHPDTYVVASYCPCERLVNSRNEVITAVTAVGYGLPVTSKLRYALEGHWVKSKYGPQYQVDSYTEVITPTKAGIIAYLSSGQIRGVGKKMAQRIYDAFGEHTLEILDKEPDKLLEVKGISQNKLERICESYESARAARYVIAFLAPYNISPKKALKLYRKYRSRTLEMVQQHPYVLQEVAGIGFLSADKIAMSVGIDPLSPERVDAGLMHTLVSEEEQGHLCMEKRDFVQKTLKLLNTDGLTEDMTAYRASILVKTGKLSCYQGMVYRTVTAQAEHVLAQRLSELVFAETPQFPCDFQTALEKEERKLGYKLDTEQRDAVLTALACSVSVITGGPGTGKTATQKIILNLYRKMFPTGRIICCAPTGRAARRMTESTGYPSSTIHSALGLNAGDDLSEKCPEPLKADSVLVDEVSMLDIHLANFLVQSIPTGCQLVLVGDADQLPSVGPGAVLRELTKYPDDIIALIALNKVHRQSAGSRIAVNASRIRVGNLSLEYGEDFQFCETANMQESAALIEQIYLTEIGKHGVDNVALLSPYRKNTITGVNALNQQLQAQVNPPHPQKAEITIGQRCFRVGDKVMQTRNHQDISNGDIGYITAIIRSEDDTTICIDFGDGRQVEYDVTELSMLDLGYALTVHKSQGSEYHTVIISVETAHSFMLVRPLIYTAVTRAKTKVILVGQRKALCTAIRREETQQRRTMLAERMKEIQSKN